MKVTIRRFERTDIPNKVRWINDPENNKYLHYDLPLEEGKTELWFEKNKERQDRYDGIIEMDGKAVGLIGLLSIDLRNKKAEYYVCLGQQDAKGKGVAKKASLLLLDYAFTALQLNKIYLYTERENTAAQALFERIGFEKEGLLKEDLIYMGRKVDRFCYGLTKREYEDRTNED